MQPSSLTYLRPYTYTQRHIHPQGQVVQYQIITICLFEGNYRVTLHPIWSPKIYYTRKHTETCAHTQTHMHSCAYADVPMCVSGSLSLRQCLIV